MEFLVSLTATPLLNAQTAPLEPFRALCVPRVLRVLSPGSAPRRPPQSIVRRRRQVLHPAWDHRLVAQLLRTFGLRRRRAVARRLQELLPELAQRERAEELLRPFALSARDGEELEAGKTAMRLWPTGRLRDPVRQQRLRCARMAFLLRRLQQTSSPPAQLARELKVPVSRVRKLLHSLRSTQGECFVLAVQKLHGLIRKRKVLQDFIRAHRADPAFLTLTVSQAHQQLLEELPEDVAVSRRAFYEAFRAAGFRYRTIRYLPPVAHPLQPAHKLGFLRLLQHFIVEEEKFHVLFLDESSLTPANFRQKRWFARGSPNRLLSRLRYERLTLLGAIDAESVVGLQLLTSRFSGSVFLAFLEQVLQRAADAPLARRQVVVVLDNSTCHHSAQLSPLLARFGAVALYNAPHHSHLNPIEFYWELLKRPLRRVSDRIRFP